MPVRDLVLRLRETARAIAHAPVTAARWMRAHASRCVAVTWLVGMTAFGVVTVRRAIVVHAAEEAAEAERIARRPVRPGGGDGPGETVAMMDVEEMEALHRNRMHANGLAAAGETDDPDAATRAAAKAKLAQGVSVEGEVITTRGGITIVTKGGIQGWLKRNRGRKADPEMLAWIRAEEAAEGREAYGGWADRDDANILEWHRSKVAGDPSGGGPTDQVVPGEPELVDPTEDGAVPASPTSSAPTSSEPTSPEPTSPEPTSPEPTSPTPSTSPPTRTATATPVARPVVRPARVPLHELAAAAVASITAAPAATGTAVVATVRAATPALGELGSITAGDPPRVTMAILAHRMFGDQGRAAELTTEGKQLVRAIVGAMNQHPRYVVRLTTTEERAIEVAAMLVVAGLPTPRLEIVVKPIDLALDVVELELVAP